MDQVSLYNSLEWQLSYIDIAKLLFMLAVVISVFILGNYLDDLDRKLKNTWYDNLLKKLD